MDGAERSSFALALLALVGAFAGLGVMSRLGPVPAPGRAGPGGGMSVVASVPSARVPTAGTTTLEPRSAAAATPASPTVASRAPAPTAPAPPAPAWLPGTLAAFHGKLLDAKGRPVPGASVTFTGENGEKPFATDAHGDYEGALPAGHYFVAPAEPEGFYEQDSIDDIELRAGLRTELRPLLLNRCARISGHVRDAKGQPIADAQLWFWRPESPADIRPRHLASGPDGGFSSDRATLGDYTVRVTAPGWASTEVAAPVTDGGSVDLDLTLARGCRVEGRLLGVAGVGSAVVSFRVPGSRWQTSAPAADGSFTLADLPAGRCDLVASDAGREHVALAHLTLDPETPSRIDLALGPAIVVEGTVREKRGAPVRGARVLLLGRHEEGASFEDDEESGPLERTAETDAQGRFRVTGIVPGRASLVVRSASGSVLAAREGFDLESTLAPLDLEVDDTVSVPLRIVAPGGSGWPSGGVGWIVAQAPPLAAPPGTHALARARFSLPESRPELTLEGLLPGPHTIVVETNALPGLEALGSWYVTAHVDVSASVSDEAPLVLTPQKGAHLLGHVLGPDGQELARIGVRVSLGSPEVWRSEHLESDVHGGFDVQVPDGRIHVAVLEGSLPFVAAQLGVARARVAPLDVDVAGGRDVDVVLRAVPE